MKVVSVQIALATLLACSAGQAAGQAIGSTPIGQEPFTHPLMDQARRLAAAGMNFVMVTSRVNPGPSAAEGGVYVFYNNPRPFCYTYMIPGDWIAARQPNAYRSKDGKAFVGVLFELPKSLEGVEGSNLVERARNAFIRWYEKASEQPVTSANLVPFESARDGTWKWTGLPLIRGEGQSSPARIIVDLSPDAVVHFTVRGTADDDGLARRVIESLKTTTSPECYFPVLEQMLRAAQTVR